MPQGKGTYGNKRGRPPMKKPSAKKGLTAKQKKLPANLQKAILKSKNKKK
jgi:hypothetical protein